jgi:glycosyltransferase involved in cell wall biosynthesis
MQPLISVLVPAYNAEHWIAETLQSAIGQSWVRKEIIVVDDGSTDGTLSVARRFESPTVRVVKTEHGGQTATLNRALAESQGDYVQYLDADDVLAYDKLAIQIERLMSEPPGTVATCTWARFYNDDLRTAVFRPQPDFRDYNVPVEWLIQSWGGHGTMPPVAWLLPRAVVEKAGPWNESLSLNNDTEYFTRVVLEADGIVFCEKSYGYYRSGNASLSGKRSRSALESFYAVCELCTTHLLNFEDSARARDACANLWQHFAHWAYPDAPDLIRSAENKARSLGGASLKLKGSAAFTIARELIGWKAARRVQQAQRRFRN